VVSEAKLNKIVRNPFVFDLKPSGRFVTIMFIDIEGFSRLSKSSSPELVFRNLQHQIGMLAAAVHAEGGVVDNVLGDGLICFFGHDYDGSNPVASHADRAVACAIKIQQKNARELLQQQSEYQHYPLRIGINSANVHIGDLGGTKRIKPTVIGSGVNFAQRLETASDSYYILASSSTTQLLKENRELITSTRLISLKHVDEFIEAYEINPYKNLPELQEVVDRKTVDPDFSGGSVCTISDGTLRFDSNLGPVDVKSVSSKGIVVVLDKYYGRGVICDMDLSAHPEIHSELIREKIFGLAGTVSSGKPLPSGRFIHLLAVSDIIVEKWAFNFCEIPTVAHSNKRSG